jgi:hypothetical protein
MSQFNGQATYIDVTDSPTLQNNKPQSAPPNGYGFDSVSWDSMILPHRFWPRIL